MAADVGTSIVIDDTSPAPPAPSLFLNLYEYSPIFSDSITPATSAPVESVAPIAFQRLYVAAAICTAALWIFVPSSSPDSPRS